MSNTASLPLRANFLHSFDELQEKRDAFLAKVEAGTAKKEDLLFYLLTVDDAGGDVIPSSMGMSWLHNNPDAFKKIVGDVNAFMDWMLEVGKFDPKGEITQDALVIFPFFKSFLLSSELMKLLSPTWRKRMIEVIYPVTGATNDCWISAALLAGIESDTIATAILNRLRRVCVRATCHDYVQEFLRHGAGDDSCSPAKIALRTLLVPNDVIERVCANADNDPHLALATITQRVNFGVVPAENRFVHFPQFAPWQVLSSKELRVALMICAEKHPGKTLSATVHSTIVQRLDETARGQIVNHAVEHMFSLDGVRVEMLNNSLTLEQREGVARRLKPLEQFSNVQEATAQFLFHIIVSLPEERHEEFWQNAIVPILKEVATTTLYRIWRKSGLVEKNIEITLRNWLADEGTLIGLIVQGQHPKGSVQYMVEQGGTRFVHNSRGHRYYPTAGDLVMFNPGYGTRLTPSVVAVNFTPVLKDI